MVFRRVLLAVVVVLGATSVDAQPQAASVSGVVLDSSGAAAVGATVRLLDGLGFEIASTTSDAIGRFVFASVALGTYTVVADAPSQRSHGRVVPVDTALPIDVELRLEPRVVETVVVEAPEAPQMPTRTTLAGAALQQLPSRIRSRALQDALATLPNWAPEDNGLLHVRGVDDGILYVQDGVPMYDRIDTLFGIPPDPSGLASMHVITGYMPPEFGVKSGAVVEVQSSVARRERWSGGVDTGVGSNDTGSARTVVGGPINERAHLGGSLAGERSSRFLDPVHPDNLHNTGGVLSGDAHLSFLSPAGDVARMNVGGGRARFDVPHNEEQEEAGQDQRQRLAQQSLSASWQRAWSDRTISQVAVHRRVIDAQLFGSPEDTPLTAASDRYQSRMGVLASVTRDAGRHTVKAGADIARVHIREDFAFAVTDDDDAEEADLSEGAMAFTPDSPFAFNDRVSRMQWALFAQDRIRLADNATVDFGLRFDRTHLLVDAWQLSPRAGIAYRWPGSNTTVRASVNRLFQPPQPEHVLLSSSAAARALSPFDDEDDEEEGGGVEAGGAEIEPERQTAWEVGAEHWFARILRLDVAYWRRHVKNYSDPNVFFGTTIVFPNSVASGTAHGLDVRLELPRYRSLSGYASYGLSRVEQEGPINGGLFLEDEAIEIGPGVTFTPDHDQRHIAAAGLTFTGGRGFSATVATRYASGTPLEVEEEQETELAERPGAELVDVERGRVRPRTVLDVSAAQTLWTTARAEVSIRLTVTNFTNTRYAFNFGNPFSGTHFGAPRSALVELHVGAR